MPFLTASLLVALFVAGCATPAAPELDTDADEIAAFLPAHASAATVPEVLGPPSRAYSNYSSDLETWEYLLAGFNRPRTLYIQLANGQVEKIFVLERRGRSSQRRIAAH